MIDKETSNIRTDRNRIEKIIKYNMPVQYKNRIFLNNDSFFNTELTHLDLIGKFTWIGK